MYTWEHVPSPIFCVIIIDYNHECNWTYIDITATSKIIDEKLLPSLSTSTIPYHKDDCLKEVLKANKKKAKGKPNKKLVW